MITKSRQEIIKRTMTNLEFIDYHKQNTGPFEVTQLVNSFLMTLLQNWDELEQGWPHLPKRDVSWPKIKTSKPNQQPHQCIGKIRDALAHGCFIFEGPARGDIESMSMWTCTDGQTVDWDLTISVNDMQAMLKCFVTIATHFPLASRKAKRTGDPCR